MQIEEKIKSRSRLLPVVQDLKRQNKVIGLTNGVFDLLHWGQVSYLREARGHCDVLIVSLNTDGAVKKYKAVTRPLVPLKDRQRLVAALEPVSFVTSHSERRMRKTLELLKPDLYIKGGDYGVSALTSRDVVESYGGKALVLSLKKGLSTTALLRKAADAALLEGRFLQGPDKEKRPAAFLDRDGVILEPVPHLHETSKTKLMPGASEGLKLLTEAGFRLLVVTNQPGIGMGHYTKEDFFRVNSAMLHALSREKVMIDAVYFCPHSAASKCKCRKPGTALLQRASEEQSLLKKGSCLFGDREMDMEAARRFRIPGALVGPGDTQKARKLAAIRGKDLREAAEKMLKYLKTNASSR